MRLESIDLQYKSSLITEYREQKETIMKYFDYKPFTSYKKRLKELRDRSFNRDALVEALQQMNTQWDAPEKTMQHIQLLKDENSVVVIGGQQAGLLTGPLYTINKIISILKLAKEQTKKLNVPVIPVFWIAGEDHDFDEINHIYTKRNNEMHKHINRDYQTFKKSITNITMDKSKTKKWLKTAFQDLLETAHTKELIAEIEDCFLQSDTYVDFFARLIFHLFAEEGLVLIDSGDVAVRHLEKEMFKQIIIHQEKISESIYETIQTLQHEAYEIPLEVEWNNSHLFYHDNHNERILLYRDGEHWRGKNDEVQLTTEQLLDIAEKSPEKLSNNVVTRPLFQEWLFPTLAFVAGDGEISYWASFKNMFHLFNVKMPPVVPRLSFTYVTKRVEKLLEKRVVDASFVIDENIHTLQTNWLAVQQQPPVEHVVTQMKKTVQKAYEPLQQIAEQISTDIAQVTDKNAAHTLEHLNFLERRITRALEEKYELSLLQFNEIGLLLKPNNVLQERIWNPLYFLNMYGTTFIQRVMEQPYMFEKEHYIVYL